MLNSALLIQRISQGKVRFLLRWGVGGREGGGLELRRGGSLVIFLQIGDGQTCFIRIGGGGSQFFFLARRKLLHVA